MENAYQSYRAGLGEIFAKYANKNALLLFDTLYNQGIEHENITRVYNWEDVGKTVINMNQR